MTFFSSLSSVRPARLRQRLTTGVAACLVLFAVGCSDSEDPAGDATDAGSTTTTVSTPDAGTSSAVPNIPAASTADAGKPTVTTTTTTDAGVVSVASDAGTSKTDASTPVTAADAGTTPAKPPAAADGGFTLPDLGGDAGLTLPDLGGLFPVSDAGTTPSTTSDGGRDVNGPCKDLNLLCFDFVDMFINAECTTCNGGKGCQGCAIPYAY
jgi:hypothetical protein